MRRVCPFLPIFTISKRKTGLWYHNVRLCILYPYFKQLIHFHEPCQKATQLSYYCTV